MSYTHDPEALCPVHNISFSLLMFLLVEYMREDAASRCGLNFGKRYTCGSAFPSDVAQAAMCIYAGAGGDSAH